MFFEFQASKSKKQITKIFVKKDEIMYGCAECSKSKTINKI